MRKTKIGLLQAYEVEENLRAAHGVYAEMFARLLHSGGLDADWQIYDARAGVLPQSPDECDGYLVSGSKHAVYEEHEWLPSLFDFIRGLRDVGAPRMAGVCFGHQAIAAALGGQVINAPQGWGVGRQQWKICGDAAWLRPRKDDFALLASHQDQVVALPPDAELLASSNFCPVAMFAIGEQFFGLQGHPEFNAAFCGAILDQREDLMPREVWEKAKASAQLPNDSAICAGWLAAFFRG